MPAYTGIGWLDLVVLGLLVGFGWGIGASLWSGLLGLLRRP